MQHFTGLQVSHEPGQWLVWGGSVLMALGLGLAFYTVHQRYWVVVLTDSAGRQALWLGTSPDKKREHFPERFRELVAAVRAEIEASDAKPVSAGEAALAQV
jgi:cytochrome c biogenesis protein